MVAYLDLQRYDPIAITFGAMRAFQEKCEGIDSSRIYRFTNVGYQWYDQWSNCLTLEGVHMGHSIMLDANSTSPAVYLGLDEDVKRSPQTRDVHEGRLYWNALEAMVLKSEKECPQGPIQLRGWEEGHWCSLDDECITGTYCREGFCRS